MGNFQINSDQLNKIILESFKNKYIKSRINKEKNLEFVKEAQQQVFTICKTAQSKRELQKLSNFVEKIVIDVNKKLNSSIKHNTLLSKNLKKISNTNFKFLIKEIRFLNSVVFVKEVAMALTDFSFNIKNLQKFIEIVSELIQRYSELKIDLLFCLDQRYFRNSNFYFKENNSKKIFALRILLEFNLLSQIPNYYYINWGNSFFLVSKTNLPRNVM